jgi:hypothetical protein
VVAGAAPPPTLLECPLGHGQTASELAARQAAKARRSPGHRQRSRRCRSNGRAPARGQAALDSFLRAVDPTQQHPAGTLSRSSPPTQPGPGAHSVYRPIATSADGEGLTASPAHLHCSAIGSAALPGLSRPSPNLGTWLGSLRWNWAWICPLRSQGATAGTWQASATVIAQTDTYGSNFLESGT